MKLCRIQGLVESWTARHDNRGYLPRCPLLLLRRALERGWIFFRVFFDIGKTYATSFAI